MTNPEIERVPELDCLNALLVQAQEAVRNAGHAPYQRLFDAFFRACPRAQKIELGVYYNPYEDEVDNDSHFTLVVRFADDLAYLSESLEGETYKAVETIEGEVLDVCCALDEIVCVTHYPAFVATWGSAYQVITAEPGKPLVVRDLEDA